MTPEQILSLVASSKRRYPDAKVFAVSFSGVWRDKERPEIEGEPFRVAACSTPLEVSAALVSEERPLLILTPLSEMELSLDVRARLAERRILRLDPWALVSELFRANSLDPRLVRQPWMADALLHYAPPEGYEPAPTGLLDLDTAWEQLLRNALGFPQGRCDAIALLRWSRFPESQTRFEELGEDFRAALLERFTLFAGPLGEAIGWLMTAKKREYALPLGVLCEALFPDEVTPSLLQAQTRLEPYLGGHPLSIRVAQSWAVAASAVLAQLDETEQKKVLESAEQLLRLLHAEEHAYRSQWLPSGFTQRVASFAALLDAVTSGHTTLADTEQALAQLERHRGAETNPARVARMRMAIRLVRTLGGDRHATTLKEAIEGYRQEGCFLDWARNSLIGGDESPELSKAFSALSQRIRARREAENHIFAQLLADWSRVGGRMEGMIPIEEGMQGIIVPAAKAAPILLIVIDGLSLPIYQELMGSLQGQGWIPLGRAHGPLPTGVSLVPSVTEYARPTLFAGRLRSGRADEEKRVFSEQPGLRGAHGAPMLFHKLELGDEEGLSAAIRDAIRDRRRRAVGVVLNAVDDHLAKSEQLRLSWDVANFRYLEALLLEARGADRLVVLTSDHGHVVEDQTRSLVGASEERWRMPDGSLAAEEILIEGARVEAVTGHSAVVVPWSECVRYSRRKNGYHGGSTPQEILVPFAVLAGSETLAEQLEEWSPFPEAFPSWWLDALLPVVPPQAIKAKKSTLERAVSSDSLASLGPLFQPPEESWIEALLGSETFGSQHRNAGKAALDVDKVRKILRVLDERNGSVPLPLLAGVVQVPSLRVRGLIQGLQRLLNVDGYPVISLDGDANILVLDLPLLKKQFELP